MAVASGTLTALAGSKSLLANNLSEFHREASKVAGQLDIQIVLRKNAVDPLVLSTLIPWGEGRPLVNHPPEISTAEQKSLRTNEITVSGVFYGRVVKMMTVVVVMTVRTNTGEVYFLDISIPTNRFAEIIKHSLPSEEWHASILDPEKKIVARWPRHEDFSGQALILSDALPSNYNGRSERMSVEGVSTIYFYTRAALSDWVVFVGLSKSTLEASSKMAITSFGAAGSILLLVAIGLSRQLGSRMALSMGALGIDRPPTREEFQVLFKSLTLWSCSRERRR